MSDTEAGRRAVYRIDGDHYVTAATTTARGGATILCCRCGIIAHGEGHAQTITRLFAAHAEEES